MFVSYYLYKYLKLYALKTKQKKLSRYLILTVNIYSKELVLLYLL